MQDVTLFKRQIARSNPNPRILVAHSGRQHSHQAALALLDAGFLGCYATGVPVSWGSLGAFCGALGRRFSVHEEVDLLAPLTHLNAIASVTNRLLGRHLPEFVVGPIYYEASRVFDRWVARLVARISL